MTTTLQWLQGLPSPLQERNAKYMEQYDILINRIVSYTSVDELREILSSLAYWYAGDKDTGYQSLMSESWPDGSHYVYNCMDMIGVMTHHHKYADHRKLADCLMMLVLTEPLTYNEAQS